MRRFLTAQSLTQLDQIGQTPRLYPHPTLLRLCNLCPIVLDLRHCDHLSHLEGSLLDIFDKPVVNPNIQGGCVEGDSGDVDNFPTAGSPCGTCRASGRNQKWLENPKPKHVERQGKNNRGLQPAGCLSAFGFRPLMQRFDSSKMGNQRGGK